MKRRNVCIVDGCSIECAKGVMAEVKQFPYLHIKLHDYGVPKHRAPEGGVDVVALATRVLEEARHAEACGAKNASVPIGTEMDCDPSTG